MRPISRREKIENYDRLVAERDVLERFAWFAVNGIVPDAVEHFEAGGTSFEYRLYGATRADGGLLAAIDRTGAQKASVACRWFDDWIREVADLSYGGFEDWQTCVKIAAERLYRARSAMIAREDALRNT